MKTGFSRCSISHRGKPVLINSVLALYWPCTGLQCDPDFVYFAIDNFISLFLLKMPRICYIGIIVFVLKPHEGCSLRPKKDN